MVLLQQKENELPTPPPLASVTLVFGARSIHDALVLDTTTAFLDCALELALCDAVTRQSVALLDRIWNASSPESFLSPADAGPGNGGRWSRRKYLRTDKHYNRYQFRRAVLEAAKIKDASVAMAIVQWLYAHFRGCVVPFGAVHYAAGDGKLDMLKFFKAHEVPPRADGGHKLRDEIQAKDGGHVVRWGRHDMAWASFSKQTEVVHWLHANTRAPCWIKTVLLNAAYNGDVELLEWLKENYRTHGPDLADEDADDEEEDEDDEDDEPMPLADELEDELGAALLPMNVAPEDMLLIDLRGIRGGPRMAGRVVEQMLRMGVHPLLGVDQNLLAELMGVGNAGIGAFLGPAQGQNQENNGSLTVTGNRLARAILGRGAEALEREDPDVFNRGNVDEATESGIFVEEILAAGLELNISVDLPHQNEQVRQFLTELAGAMEDDEEEDQEAGLLFTVWLWVKWLEVRQQLVVSWICCQR